MVKVAVIDVPLTTVVLLTVMPVPLRPIVAPDAKFAPVIVTPPVCPCVPELGLTELSVGAPAFTVNVCVPLVPVELVTVTFWAPVGAFEAMVNVAVIDVLLTTAVLLPVMPVPLRPIVAPDAKFVPVSVTGTVCPWVPELGLTELSVGAPPLSVDLVFPAHPAIKTTIRSAIPRPRDHILPAPYLRISDVFILTDMLFLHSSADRA